MTVNKQAIIKTDHESDTLKVHSIFYTLQGEGPFVGRPALFVRLAGCNLRCFWCDTEYSNDAKEYTTYSLVSEIFQRLQELPPSTIVVLTGGEPMAQNISELVFMVSDHYIIQLETNGTVCPPSFPFLKKNVHVVVSPKAGKIDPMLLRHERYVLAWKYVVEWDDLTVDGLPALSTQVKGKKLKLFVPENVKLDKFYVSPKDDENIEANTKHALQVALTYGYNLSLQTHKIVNIE